jgi:hypothetical protein
MSPYLFVFTGCSDKGTSKQTEDWSVARAVFSKTGGEIHQNLLIKILLFFY